jgi:hypothetical protein
MPKTGEIFGCGIAEKYRFFISTQEDVKMSRAAEMTGGLQFCWMSVGCSNTIAQVGFGKLLNHRLVTQSERLCRFLFVIRIGRNTEVDISSDGRASLGCEIGEEVTIRKRSLRFGGRLSGDRVLLINPEGKTVILSIAEFVGVLNTDEERTQSGITQRFHIYMTDQDNPRRATILGM